MNYISVLLFQSKSNVDINTRGEFCIFDDEWNRQFNKSVELIKEFRPDIVIFPETNYNELKQKIYKELMEYSTLIVAGSTYEDGCQNRTVTYYRSSNNEIEIRKISKNNASPLEVATRYMEYQSFDNLCSEGLWNKDEHTFKIKGKEVIVLNCMEYYNSAYYISRSGNYNKNLFAIICPCSSNNIELFEQETIALSNHKENIYSFICNRVSTIESSNTKGKSYIYGTISRTEKKLLNLEFPEYTNLKHPCGIAQLKEESSYIYGEYVINDGFCPFGRSDNYVNTPKNMKIGKL